MPTDPITAERHRKADAVASAERRYLRSHSHADHLAVVEAVHVHSHYLVSVDDDGTDEHPRAKATCACEWRCAVNGETHDDAYTKAIVTHGAHVVAAAPEPMVVVPLGLARKVSDLLDLFVTEESPDATELDALIDAAEGFVMVATS